MYRLTSKKVSSPFSELNPELMAETGLIPLRKKPCLITASSVSAPKTDSDEPEVRFSVELDESEYRLASTSASVSNSDAAPRLSKSESKLASLGEESNMASYDTSSRSELAQLPPRPRLCVSASAGEPVMEDNWTPPSSWNIRSPSPGRTMRETDVAELLLSVDMERRWLAQSDRPNAESVDPSRRCLEI
jgi:hypothetical protein